jgi:hypothetical protein
MQNPTYIRKGNKIYLLSANGKKYIQQKARIGEGSDPVTAIANAVTEISKQTQQIISLVYSLFHSPRKEEIENIKAENSALSPLVESFLGLFPQFPREYFRVLGQPSWEQLQNAIAGNCPFPQGQTCKFDDHAWINTLYRNILFNYAKLIPNFQALQENLVRRAKYPYTASGTKPEVQAEINKVLSSPQVQNALRAGNTAGTNTGTNANTAYNNRHCNSWIFHFEIKNLKK